MLLFPVLGRLALEELLILGIPEDRVRLDPPLPGITDDERPEPPQPDPL
jgi:hypothetical protein